MAISNKKRKAILREHPGKSVKELAEELGLSAREVKSVLAEEGRIKSLSKKQRAVIAGAAVLIVVTAGAVYAVLSRPGPSRLARKGSSLNLLFVTIDTCRADHIGCYGFRQAHTPVIDGLAAKGVRFNRAFCLQPLTLPSHATILTGTHPAFHGIEDNGLFRLPDKAETLAEVLSANGWETGAVISSYVLHRQFGLDQGFDYYDDGLSAQRRVDSAGFEEMEASGVSDRALAWLDKNQDKKWFLWLHYFDPHADYNPPQRFLSQGMATYDGEIAYVDFELGRVMSALKEHGLDDDTLVIVTADHGESLGEHGELTHGMFLYDSVMRIPMIFSLPDAIPGGRTAGQMVSVMDLAPTALSILGIDGPAQVQGRSLKDLLFSDPEGWQDEVMVMETAAPWYQYGWSPSKALRESDYKYIRAPHPELYDLENDPREKTNVLDRNRGRAEAMSRELKSMRAELEANSLAGDSRLAMDEASRDKLASLGYLFTGSSKGSEQAVMAPDVKDMVEVMGWIYDASALKKKGQIDEAIALLEKVLERSPDNKRALNRIGTWYGQKHDYQNAEKYLQELIRIDPDFTDAYLNLGQIYADSNRLDQATAMAQTVLTKSPRSAKAQNLLGFVLFQAKDYRGAIAHFDKAIELFPTYHEAYANRAVSYYHLGEYQKALENFRAAHTIVPENTRYKKFVEQLTAEMASKK